MPKLGKSTFDILRPIGSYYETSDINFNPNTASGWYGTWVEDTKGQTLVSRNNGTFANVGSNVGSETHGGHSLSDAYAKLIIRGSGAIEYREKQVSSWQANYTSGTSGSAGNSSNSHTWGTEVTGNTNAGSSIQPSKVVVRWHRTA